ncbi:HAD family hydrolase [Streptomyces sp. FH025]|uniref:HAD-IIIC family phosphatase n=1 Tax=Streptomyces sp. FH025 TaxID=2815937 RepID=UPI001A9D0C57|nr:HAD-IIIC family phosphatase [Streptomyces sp. FH025]MBO1413055.1 HAD-IIIC family phosphatase [Streptomyces sp. FH025]
MSADVLKKLRALRREGLGDAAPQVRALLGEIEEVLGLESAGALLTGPAQLAELATADTLVEQRVALLGNATLDQLPNLLTAVMIREGLLPRIRSAGFNQWRFEILAGAPELADLSPRITALLLDDGAVFEGVADPLDPAEVERRCEAFAEELDAWAAAAQSALGGLTVLCTVPLSPLRRDRVIDYRGKARLEAAWQRMNAAVLGLAERRDGVVVLSHEGVAAHAGALFGGDRMRHVAAHVWAPEFLAAYAEELTRVARADLGRAAKCLVLDLDDTLWGGVVGDDGVGALRIGGSYPGSAHRELQQLARDLMTQGVMLAVASKNDDAVAREAIATHPEMVLRPDDFVAVHATWEPKPDSVRALAAELNIGADAMVFVDDNPVERGLMRELRPEVTTVELPADPARYASLLAARGDFNLLRLTGEDRERTRLYRERSQRAELAATAGDLTEYLTALGSELTLEPAGPLNSARIVQLFGKTNQFNLTGIRYGDLAGGPAFFGARLADRYGDNGLIAALAIEREEDGAWSIGNFVLSCRAFSRGVEDAIVGLVLRAAAAAGAPAVTARYVPSAKNTRFAGFYPSLGFATTAEQDGTAAFRHPLTGLAEPPAWIRITNDEGVLHVR